MKKISKALLLLSTGTLLVLGSCGGNQNQSTTPSASSDSTALGSSETKMASRIKHEEIPYMEQGVALDLDQYITIEYSDGTTDKSYEISCAKSTLVIVEGTHKIKSDEIDTFTVQVKAGALTTKLTIEVLSNEQLKLMSFLAPLEQTPRNYTIDLSSDGEYFYSLFHNEKYTAIWDKNDPAALDKNGDPDSTILAELNDGNAYWGSVGKDEQGNPKPTFESGPVKDWTYYYFTMDLSLDATESAWTTYEGEEVLMLGSTFCQNLLNYGCGQLPDRKGYEYYGAIVTDTIDVNIDGNPDKYVFDCLVKSGTQIGTYCTVTLYDIGATAPALMTTAINDDSYVPAKITADEIPTTFNAIGTAANYTATLKLWSATSSSLDLNTPDAATAGTTDACSYFFGSNDVVITQKVTADGIYYEYKGKQIVQSGSAYAFDSNYSLMAASAVFNDGGKGYSTSLDTTDGSATLGQIKAATEIQGTTDVFTLPAVKSLTASAVTKAAVDSTVWTNRQEDSSSNTVTLKGDVGDNTVTTVENALFGQLLDMFGNGTYGVLKSMGTTWTTAEDFNQGDKHALSLYSKYESFAVNTATNEVSIVFNMYAPIGISNGYFGMSLTIDHIGTTSFDFSAIKDGVASPSLMA